MLIFRYLSTQVLQIVAVVTVVLLSVSLTGRFIQYLGDAVVGEQSPDILLLLMLYRIPEFLLVILPLALFLAIILAYGRMYADNEMVILFGAGISQARLTFHTLGATTVVLLIVASMSLYLAPLGLRKAEELKQTQQELTEIDLIVAGQFQSFGDGERITYTERIRDVVTRGYENGEASDENDRSDERDGSNGIEDREGRELHNVFVALSPGGVTTGEPPRLVFAETARPQIDTTTGARFMRLDNVRQYDGEPGSGAFAVAQFDTQLILLPAPAEFAPVLEESTLPTLSLPGSGEVALQAELQWRVSSLILVAVISLIAVPMSRVNPRQGRYRKLVPAALIYVFYFVALEFCKDLIAEGNLNPALGLWWIHLFFLAVGLAGYSVRLKNLSWHWRVA